MSYVLDLILLVIIALAVLISAHKGFVRTIIEVVGFFAAIVIALTVSRPLADATYRTLIEKPMLTAADSTVGDIAGSVWDALPDFITENAEIFGISKEAVAETVGESAGESASAAAQKASEALVKPAATRLIGGLYACILFIILMIVVQLLARLINKLFSFHLVGKVNRTLGGLLGLIKGLLYAFVFCTLVTLIASLNHGAFLIFTDDTIGGSLLFRFFAGLSSFYPF